MECPPESAYDAMRQALDAPRFQARLSRAVRRVSAANRTWRRRA
jgi:hypothetical protein